MIGLVGPIQAEVMLWRDGRLASLPERSRRVRPGGDARLSVSKSYRSSQQDVQQDVLDAVILNQKGYSHDTSSRGGQARNPGYSRRPIRCQLLLVAWRGRRAAHHS